jgi:hypothetical protein
MDKSQLPTVGARLRMTYAALWQFLGVQRPIAQVGVYGAAFGEPAAVLEAVDDAVGWKVAVIEDLKTLRFGGYSWGSYPVSDVSSCLTSDHPSPAFECRCGFHAYRRRSDAEERLNRRFNAVLLRVGLYGSLVEHSSGWRAEQQDVLSIHLPARCLHRRCTSDTGALRKDGSSWKAVCALHAGLNGVTLSQLRQRHDVDIVTDL